ncbi:O-antigen ligase [Nocardioides marinisabuli]|uniref:O-antigen ligase n=1 Tax=Nocardioides marinisabuli TaxID=419476 RepID=A0A7Y9F2L1_9ACTN|nr:O-antigen ligase family protein [Nocardioides marinisabuli]NYD57575.1 O-antigen ligase [Nocardioides marinisabuli]
MATLLSRINEAAVAGILVGVFSVYWGVIHLRLDLKLLAPTLAFLTFWILSSAVAGSLPSQTGESVADWIENDGRPLFAVLPVFIAATAKFKQIDLAWFAAATVFGIWANLLFALATGPRIGFTGLTSSHHVLGYFGGSALIIILGYWEKPRPFVIRASIAGAVLLVFLSASRTSLVGLVMVLVFFAFRAGRLRQLIRAGAASLVFAALALFDPRVRSTVSTLVSADFWQRASSAFAEGFAAEEVLKYPLQAGVPEYAANMISRFYYWGNAVGMWGQSPVLGVGFGRYNDSDLSYSGVDGLVRLATQGSPSEFSVIGAHNQYLGLLAEGGVLGLALVLFIWIGLGGDARAPGAVRKDWPQYMIVFSLGTGLTGYTLVSPSLTFMALSWLVLSRSVRQEEWALQQTTSASYATSMRRHGNRARQES